ncbi:MAG TPA: ATP-binding cassette domain-containing protein, partial [Anaeromyxobacteraceae bacterium]|nr:ATP-binding cassette domain-containing protein [Anaeromyxobacteraceae bacterium]
MSIPSTSPQASTRSAPPISARGVGKRFATNGSEVVALQGVDVEVKPGEFLSIIGGSGCGKST